MENITVDYQTTNQVVEKCLPKASKVTMIGIGIAIVGSLFSIIPAMMYTNQLNEIVRKTLGTAATANMGTNLSGSILGIGILAVFMFLAIRLKRAKSKAIAINLIVFASIFVVLGLISLVFVFASSSFMDETYRLIKASPSEIANLKQLYLIMNVLSLIGIVGWSVVLFGGIKGVRVSEAELEENRLPA